MGQLLRFGILISLCLCFSNLAAVIEPQSHSSLSAANITQLRSRAAAGDAAAQLELGRAYDEGNEVSQSDQEAVTWYRAAAELGNSVAQNNLGLMFSAGRGVEKDKTATVNWYRKAARQGNASAMFNLGAAYYNGDGVVIDDTASFAWFLLAQQAGNRPADDAVNRARQDAKTIEADAFEKVGDMYAEGGEIPRNSREAVNWYCQAAQTGAPRLDVKLAGALFENPSAASDSGEVLRLCEKAAKSKYSPALYCMGEIYKQGLGVQPDLPKAAKWFSQAANMGHAIAALRLGEMYWDGEGVKKDKITAYELIYLASTSNVAEAKSIKDRVEKDLTPDEIAKGKAKAAKFRPVGPVILKSKQGRD